MKKMKRILLLFMSLILLLPANIVFASEDGQSITQAFSKEKIMAKDMTNKTLDLELKGIVKLADNYSVYQLKNGKTIKKSLSDVMVGAENIAVYYNNNGQVYLIIIDGDTPVKNMRIGIMNNGFASLDHSRLDIKSAEGFTLVDKKANRNFNINPNSVITFTVDANSIKVVQDNIEIYRTSNRLYTIPVNFESNSSKLQITTFSRAYGNPLYRGFFEITLTALGKLNLVNEVDLENYLYQVVPSEMPASFGLEALKAQAVAARTYALGDYYSSRYSAKGFYVDDSTLSQVYNNSAENALTTQAVNETKGIIMKSNGSLVDARYYSTSGGYGASKNEVWSDSGTNAFPGVSIPYLVGKSYTYDPNDNTKMLNIDTSNEEQINAFYKTLSYTGYDSDSLYFRWKVGLTKQQFENTVNKNILLRYAADPNFILTKDENGNFVSKPIPAQGIGTLVNMYVAKRGVGGNIMELVIEGSTGTYKILKEYNIRFTIRPTKTDTGAATDILAYRAKGGMNDYDPTGTLKNPSILYSAFFTFDIDKDINGQPTAITFYGGGNGHGVGMSQYGASALGAKGWSYDKILTSYYSNMNLVDANEGLEPQSNNALSMLVSYAINVMDSVTEGILEGQQRPGSKAAFKVEIDKAAAIACKQDVTDSELQSGANALMNSIEIFKNSKVTAEEAIQYAKEKAAIDAIAALPDPCNLTLKDEQAVVAARQLVSAANNDTNITNLDKLVACETRMQELKRIQLAKEKAAIDAINALPDPAKIKLKDMPGVLIARALVTIANNDANITNLSKLVACEEKLASLKARPANIMDYEPDVVNIILDNINN